MGAVSSRLDLRSGTAVEADLSYLFRPRWTVELSALRARLDMDVTAEGASSYAAGNAKLGLLALMIQYHPFVLWNVRPYLGVGAHLATLTGFEPTQELLAHYVGSISFTRTVSVAGEVGADYLLTDRLSLNALVRFHDVGTEASVILPTGAKLGSLHVAVDPWVFAFGVGYRF